MANVGAFFTKTLPSMALTVASGVPGPIGMVAALVSQVVGSKIKADPASIDTAIQAANGDQMLQLKQLDAQHGEAMAKIWGDNLEDMAKIGAADTADARLLQRTDKSWIPPTLAIMVFAMFGAALALAIFHGIPANGHDVVVGLINVLGTILITIIGFYFGSSKGSADKNAPLMNLANAAANGGK